MLVSKDYPLVGFHGRVDDQGILSLGTILHDSQTKECQKAHAFKSASEYFSSEDDYEKALIAESMVSSEESLRNKKIEHLLREGVSMLEKKSGEGYSEEDLNKLVREYIFEAA